MVFKSAQKNCLTGSMYAKGSGSAGKRVFLGIIAVIALVLFAFTAAFWFLAFNIGRLNRVFFLALGIIAAGLLAIVTMVLCITVAALTDITGNPHAVRFAKGVIDALTPLCIWLGPKVGIEKDIVMSSFIALNNRLSSKEVDRQEPGDILVLAPHCMQDHNCLYKVTDDLNNCRRCGKCQISELLKLRDKYGIKLYIATGGTFARRAVVDAKPKAVIAIACERDLTSGIQDAQVPVLGITNERPNGPCRDTVVDMQKVEEAISFLLKGKTNDE